MTPREALLDLVARVGARDGAAGGRHAGRLMRRATGTAAWSLRR